MSKTLLEKVQDVDTVVDLDEVPEWEPSPSQSHYKHFKERCEQSFGYAEGVVSYTSSIMGVLPLTDSPAHRTAKTVLAMYCYLRKRQHQLTKPQTLHRALGNLERSPLVIADFCTDVERTAAAALKARPDLLAIFTEVFAGDYGDTVDDVAAENPKAFGPMFKLVGQELRARGITSVGAYIRKTKGAAR